MSKNKHIEDNPFSPYEDQDSLLKSLMASAKSAGVPEELINGINENLALALQDADETTSPKDLFLASYREELGPVDLSGLKFVLTKDDLIVARGL